MILEVFAEELDELTDFALGTLEGSVVAVTEDREVVAFEESETFSVPANVREEPAEEMLRRIVFSIAPALDGGIKAVLCTKRIDCLDSETEATVLRESL